MKFFYYYNRIKSAEQKKTVLTIKFGRTILHANKIICDVSTYTRNRKIRPYCVVAGNANGYRLDHENTIWIN